MSVSFDNITTGKSYTRPQLAKLWGFLSYHAFAKGVFTPSKSNLIILFVTKEKQKSLRQYDDLLVDDILSMDGEANGGSDSRVVNSTSQNDEVHLFYRELHHRPFVYHGLFVLTEAKHSTDGPTRFRFVRK